MLIVLLLMVSQAKVTLLQLISPIEEILLAGTDHPIFVLPPGHLTRAKTSHLSSLQTPQMRGVFGEFLFYTVIKG